MTTRIDVGDDRTLWSPTELNTLRDAVAELQGIANGGSLPATGDVTLTADSDASGAGDLVVYLGTQERLRVTNGGDFKITGPTGDPGNGLNVEHDSTTTPALRLHQTSSGGIAKWRQGTTDVGFIKNSGAFQLLPVNDRAVSAETITWAADRTFPFGSSNRDGVFYIHTFTDASGVASPVTYTKLYGGSVAKTGHGNLDAFWATIDHSGDGEAGLFIGDVNANAAGSAGNIWGGHFQLNMPIAVNAYGLRVELNPSVDVSSKTQIGIEVKNDTDARVLTQGVRVAGNFTTPLVVYSDAAGSAERFSAGGTNRIQLTTAADAAVLIRFNTDRPWKLIQDGTAGSTALTLMPESASKIFKIIDSTRTLRSLEVLADGTAPYVKIAPDTGGKVSFFGVTQVAQQQTTGTSTGFTAGAGTTVTHLSTFTAGSGSTAYTIGDIVLALKNYGLLKA